MRVLLTGATGFIGGHLLQALIERGHDVVCAIRNPPDRIAAEHVSYVQADFVRDVQPADWVPRLHDIDVVINAVGILQERGEQTFDAIHTHAPRALFLACAQAGVKRVIQISALGADETATSRYHLTKKGADDALARLDLRWVIVQPSLVYGAEGTSAQLFTMLASLPVVPVLGTGEQAVQPVHIEDLVAAVLALLEPDSPAHVRVPIVGPQALPFATFLHLLRAQMRLAPTATLRVPMPLVRLAAGIGSAIPGSMLDRETLAMLERGNTGSPQTMAALIGRMPRPVTSFIPDEFAMAIRTSALLRWLLPILRVSIALTWIATGVVSLGVFPVDESYGLLARVGVPAGLQPLLLYGAAGLDLLLGSSLLVVRKRRWLWLLQGGVILAYTLIITFKLPEFWLHPYGPILKNVPLLAAIWLLYELEKGR